LGKNIKPEQSVELFQPPRSESRPTRNFLKKLFFFLEFRAAPAPSRFFFPTTGENAINVNAVAAIELSPKRLGFGSPVFLLGKSANLSCEAAPRALPHFEMDSGCWPRAAQPLFPAPRANPCETPRPSFFCQPLMKLNCAKQSRQHQVNNVFFLVIKVFFLCHGVF